MIDYLTLGIRAARSWTRVDAFEIDAGTIGRTVGIDRALWTAALVRVPEVTLETRARASVVPGCADRVRSAR